MEFMEVYEQLNEPHQQILQDFLKDTMKPVKLRPYFFCYFPYCLKKKNWKLVDIARKLEETYVEVDVEDTLRKAIKNKNRTCIYSKDIAEIMGISEDMILYGVEKGMPELSEDAIKNRGNISIKDTLQTQKVVLLNQTLSNIQSDVKKMYERLDKKLKPVVLNLAMNLWYYQYVPEYWDKEDWEDLE